MTWSSEPTRTRVGTPTLAEFGPHVEGGQRLAGGDVAAGVGGADHLHGPLGDRGLGGGEAAGEPALGRRCGRWGRARWPDDHPALPELVGRAEAGRGGDQRERGDAAPGGAAPARGRWRRRARSPRSRSAARRARRAWPAAGRRGRRRSPPGRRGRRRARAGRNGRPATAGPARAPAGPTCAMWYPGRGRGSGRGRLPARRSGIAGCSVVSRSPVRRSHTAPSATAAGTERGSAASASGKGPVALGLLEQRWAPCVTRSSMSRRTGPAACRPAVRGPGRPEDPPEIEPATAECAGWDCHRRSPGRVRGWKRPARTKGSGTFRRPGAGQRKFIVDTT